MPIRDDRSVHDDGDESLLSGCGLSTLCGECSTGRHARVENGDRADLALTPLTAPAIVRSSFPPEWESGSQSLSAGFDGLLQTG